MAFGPGEKRLDHVSHPCGGGFGNAGLQSGKLVKFLLGKFLVFLALDQADFLTPQGNHPPANVLAEPNAIRACHTKPPVVE
jgi:hypothetical protein